ncbi:MAG: pitrilysin family protein, partial [Verrucomicrobiota bacterium]
MNAAYQTTRLPNGVLIATATMPYLESVCCGVWGMVGSRFESESENGMAHFLEHLLFKGTPTRDPYAISREIEGLGATIDAFTAEDHTCFSTRGPSEAFGPMIDVLLDIYLNPTFDPAEIERERVVILEEIAMYRDNPSQHVEDLLGAAAWPQHPLGLPITGTEESVKNFRRGDLFAFHQKHYCGGSTLITVAGKITHEEVLDEVADRVAGLEEGEAQACAGVEEWMASSGPRRCEEERELEQAHVCIGFHTESRHHPQRYAMKVLNVLLGENMSSRLFQVLREEHGLCYSVFSDVMSLEDTGILSVYAGLDVENLPKALELSEKVLRELSALCPSQEEIQQAMNYTIGQSRIALESSYHQMAWLGESLQAYQRVVEPEETFAALRSVSVEDVRE